MDAVQFIQDKKNKLIELANYLAYLRWMSTPSSNIDRIQYLEDNQILQVQFVSGSKYQYYNVPVEVYEELMRRSGTNESVGSYFYYNVRTSFRYKQI